MGTFSLRLPFQQPPRLTAPGFRWAPASFLNCSRATTTSPFRDLRGTIALGPEGNGLVFTSAGFIFTNYLSFELIGGDDFHMAVAGEAIPTHSVGYRWAADRAMMAAENKVTLTRPAFAYLGTDLATNPTVLADLHDDDIAHSSGIIQATFVAVVFVAPVARFANGELRRGIIYDVT